MGITDNRRGTYEFPYISNELNRIENYFDYREDKPDSNMAIDSSPLSKGKKSKGKSKFYKCYLDRSIRAAKKGVRQARRTENTNFLLTMSEKDEVDCPEMDFTDLMEHGLTPFATLFVEQEKMKIWNDFINQSEDEQQQVLKGSKPSTATSDLDLPDFERQDSTGSWEMLDDDKRSIHPGYSPKECFERIERRLQLLLSRRHLPLGMVLSLEEDIISFFMEWPHSVFVSRLETSFDRMILHALCQYLDLDSCSYDDKDGVRQTQVENQHSEFVLPTMTLSNYIEYRSHKL